MPERKPAILAGYQSPEEAKAELGLVPAETLQGLQSKPSETMPGGRSVDLVVALRINRMVHEPDIADSQEAFLTAVQLAEDERFQRARRSLFDWEDKLYVDGWSPEEVEKELPGLEEEYRDAVRAQIQQTRRRWIATLLPRVAGWAITASGHPHLKEPVSKSLEFVAGRFVAMNSMQVPDPEAHPGAALHIIRAAYRNQQPEPPASLA